MKIITVTYISGYRKIKPEFDLSTSEGFEAQDRFFKENFKLFQLRGAWAKKSAENFAKKRGLVDKIEIETKQVYLG